MEIVKRVHFGLHLKGYDTVDIRGESVMFVRGVYISTLWYFHNQCRVNTFTLGATSVCLVLNILGKTLHFEGNKVPKANLKFYLQVHSASQP